MSESEFQIVKSAGFVLALALAVGLQRISPHAGAAGSWRLNGALWFVDAAVMGVVCGACACTVSRWAQEGGLGLLNVAPAALWVAIPVSVLALDLVSYAWHRANHGIPLLWRFHQVHHSDPAFTATTALRFHPGEILLSLPVRLAAVVAIGVPVEGVIVFEVLFALANFVEHGDIDLPRTLERLLARIIVTPALHRRHHGRQLALLNTNFATIFSVWDRVFRSFANSSSDVSVHIGLPGAPDTLGPLEALALPAAGVLRGD